MWCFTIDGLWDSRPSYNCPRIKACPVCSFIKVPKLTMKGICPESVVDYYWYLDKSQLYGVYYDGYKGDKIYSEDSYRTWMFKERSINSLNYSIDFSNGPSFPVGFQFWKVSDSLCNTDFNNKTKMVLSACTLGSEFTCYNGECIPKTKRCDNIIDCSDNSDEDNCKAIIVNDMYDKSKFSPL